MKIFITGANGFLSQYITDCLLKETEHEIIATGAGKNRMAFEESNRLKYFPLDITDAAAVNNFLFQQKPSVVIHAAAKSQPDYCELNKADCWNSNVTATRFLIDACKSFNPYFIFISTDFVFDGSKGMYSEDDAVGAVNYYGSTKITAEKAVMESGLNYAVARTCLCYGPSLQPAGRNFFKWVIENVNAGKMIQVYNDQLRTATYAGDFAKGILLLIKKQAKGIYHISGKEVLTPYNMAIEIARYFSLDKTFIKEATAADFTEAAIRPLKTGFNIDKAKNELGFAPLSFNEALAYCKK